VCFLTCLVHAVAACFAPPVQVEGDTAKLSDGYFAVQTLDAHVAALSAKYGSFTNLLMDDSAHESTLALAFDFSSSFAADWERRKTQAITDVVVAAAVLDPRYKDKAGKIPPNHHLNAQNFIVEQAERLCGHGAGVKAQVCTKKCCWGLGAQAVGVLVRAAVW
jgi:hypothetical protein